jgi:hypothetical protein
MMKGSVDPISLKVRSGPVPEKTKLVIFGRTPAPFFIAFPSIYGLFRNCQDDL